VGRADSAVKLSFAEHTGTRFERGATLPDAGDYWLEAAALYRI
jgi:hypothetical protein